MSFTASAEQIENAIIVASLAHLTAKSPKQRRQAWDRLMALKAQREQARTAHGTAEAFAQ